MTVDAPLPKSVAGIAAAAAAGPAGTGPAAARSVSRLAAVQALYQMDMASTDLNDVIQEFVLHRFGEQAKFDFADADTAFFTALVKGVVARQREIDPMLDAQLAAGWRLARIDSILRAILRSGTFELIARRDVPTGVIINEYLEVAKAFFGGDEPKVVNGVLDALAKKIRV